MGSYTHRNLADLDDAAAAHGAGDSFSSRFGRDALDCEHTGFALQRLAPGATAPFAHRHEQAEEVYVILEGGGRMLLDEEVLTVGRRDAIRVSPGVARSFEAGPEGLELLVFGPHHKNDGEILQVQWPAA
ncbi:MAG: Cupin 2 conserved barrel domain protein [Solirubrobacterales bacterium]|nr:Cupin 2 conserved barrel domain protein [Solirubrobacterales bacterium]